LLESYPMRSALWNTLGLAMETNIKVQSGEVISFDPTTKGCGSPEMTAPGQKRVVLWRMVRVLLAEVQDIVPSSRGRERVIHGWKETRAFHGVVCSSK